MNVQRVPLNTRGRDFFVGDIHGLFARLQALLERAGFDATRDRLFTPGDLVDRGPDSLAALQWLQKHWFFSTRGNHEQMAINFARGHNHPFQYERNGGRWFIDLPAAQQLEIAERFERLPLAIELERPGGIRVGFVHAEVPWNDWSRLERWGHKKDAIETALWARTRIDASDTTHVSGIDLVIVGHTPVPNFGMLGNVLYTDTGSVFGRPMAISCLDTGEVWEDVP